MNHDEILNQAKEIATAMGWHIETFKFQADNLSSDGVNFIGVMWPERQCVKQVFEITSNPAFHGIARTWATIQARHSYHLEATVTNNGQGFQHAAADFIVYDTRFAAVHPLTKNDVKNVYRRFCEIVLTQLRQASLA